MQAVAFALARRRRRRRRRQVPLSSGTTRTKARPLTAITTSPITASFNGTLLRRAVPPVQKTLVTWDGGLDFELSTQR